MHLNMIWCAVAICCIFAGCDSESSSDPVVNVEATDEAMNGAVEKAQQTFPQFLKHWKTMPSDSVGVKVGLSTSDDEVEHIWFEPITITDTEVSGICANDPNKIPNLKLGDKRTFGRSEVSDWMILVGDKCYGGYTIRVLSQMEPENAPPFAFLDLEDAP